MELGRQDSDSSKRMKMTITVDTIVSKGIEGADYFEFQHFLDQVMNQVFTLKNVSFNNQLYQFFSNAPVTCQHASSTGSSSTGSSSTGSGDKRDGNHGNHVVNQSSVSYTTEMMVSKVPEVPRVPKWWNGCVDLTSQSTGSTGSSSVSKSIDLQSKTLDEKKSILTRNNSLNEVILRCRGVERKALVFKVNLKRVAVKIEETGEFINFPYDRIIRFLGKSDKPHPYTEIKEKLNVGEQYSTTIGRVTVLKKNSDFAKVRQHGDGKLSSYPYEFFNV